MENTLFIGDRVFLKPLDKTIKYKEVVVFRFSDSEILFVKRCMGLPGQTIKFINNVTYNDIESLNISNRKYFPDSISKHNRFILLQEDVDRYKETNNKYDNYISNCDSTWDRANFGPLWIPKRGETILLTIENINKYGILISKYENNNIKISSGKILINNKESLKYTFKKDYYFLIGDNRIHSTDSRLWGLIPEDLIIYRADLILISKKPKSNNNDKSTLRFLKKLNYSNN
jgi:signal peptidase I